MPSFTSVRNRFIEGILDQFGPNEIRLSFKYSLNLSLDNLQEYPLGGKVFLPLGVTISYMLASIGGHTERSLDFQTHLGSISGLEYRSLAASLLGSLLSSKPIAFFAYTKILS